MSHQPQERHNVCFFALPLTFIASTECATLAEFGGSATAEETARTTTIATTDDSEKGEVTFRESGRIVVGKKGRRAKYISVYF